MTCTERPRNGRRTPRTPTHKAKVHDKTQASERKCSCASQCDHGEPRPLSIIANRDPRKPRPSPTAPLTAVGKLQYHNRTDGFCCRRRTSRTKATDLCRDPILPGDCGDAHKALRNPYCRGAVNSKGTEEHPGVHRPPVEQALWQQAQNVLDAHQCGQRERPHRHCLKPVLRPTDRTGQTPHPGKGQDTADKESPATSKKQPRNRPAATHNERTLVTP